MKILLVEDNIKMRAMIKKYLERSLKNIDVIYECDDGAKAIELYTQFQPDWVLMGINLKNVDGLTATQAITNINPTVKILIVTQYNDPAYREAAFEAGASNYILKDNIAEIPKLILSINCN